jgi:orotidine-5'-phosphate decarboxylase
LNAKDRIIVAIDTKDVCKALEIVNTLKDYVGGFKIGLEFFTSTYAQLINSNDYNLLDSLGELYYQMTGKLFWDGKWDDIPNTIKGATTGINSLHPKFVNIHVSAGIDSIISAVENSKSIVLGVTVLTSISEDECISIFGDSPNSTVTRFARKLIKAKAGGIICSPKELLYLQEQLQPSEFSQLEKVIPGIRPEWAQLNDQKRVMTPSEAIKAGAQRLVIGRPITDPPTEIGNMLNAVGLIIDEIESGG